jgi:hypothetical protein
VGEWTSIFSINQGLSTYNIFDNTSIKLSILFPQKNSCFIFLFHYFCWITEERHETKIEGCGSNLTYVKDDKNPYNPYAPDPDKYRAGVLALRIGGIVSIGCDAEEIRYVIQNVIAHNFINSAPYFRYEPYKPKFYFQIGY